MNAAVDRSDETLQEAVQALIDGRDTRENFRLVFERFYTPVYRLFKHKGMSHEDSCDLAQEVFLTAYRRIHDVRDAAQFPAWLFTVARNVFNGELERRHSQKRSGLRLVTAAHADEPADMDRLPARDTGRGIMHDLLDREKTEKLQEALRNLPTQMRRCVHLRIAEDSSYEEIAAALGISVNTVKVQLHRARKELRWMLSSYFEQTPAGGRE